jgi:Zn finger protein HypA/HybF involved in hydrogenase expression
MHESGLVEELIETMEEVARANGGGRIVRAQIGIGQLAGFTFEHFEEHFRGASIGTLAENAQLAVEPRQGDCVTLEGIELDG